MKICHRKQTFGGVLINYESFIPTYRQRGLLHTLLHRSFSICCGVKTFHFEIDHLKTILIKTIIPRISKIGVLNHFLKDYIHLNLRFRIYLKEMFFVTLPYLGSTSFQIWKKLQKLLSDKLTPCNLKIVSTSPFRVKSFFTFKDKLPRMLFSGLV